MLELLLLFRGNRFYPTWNQEAEVEFYDLWADYTRAYEH